MTKDFEYMYNQLAVKHEELKAEVYDVWITGKGLTELALRVSSEPDVRKHNG